MASQTLKAVSVLGKEPLAVMSPAPAAGAWGDVTRVPAVHSRVGLELRWLLRVGGIADV